MASENLLNCLLRAMWHRIGMHSRNLTNAAIQLHDKTDKVKAYTLLNLVGAEAIKCSKTFDYKPDVQNEANVIVQQA